MRSDGPTIDERSPIDKTSDVNKQSDDDNYNKVKRPIDNKTEIINWFSDNIKGIVYGIIISLVASFLFWEFNEILDHKFQLLKHDWDINSIKETNQDQEDNIDLIQKKNDELNKSLNSFKSDVQLELERIESNSKKKKTK